jgi:hypothetical protein
MEALAGVAPDGTIAWLNGAGARLIGRLPEDAGERDVESMLGHDLTSLLRLERREAAQPIRLASGLGVWVQARLKAADGADFRHAVAMPGETLQVLPIEPATAMKAAAAEGVSEPVASNLMQAEAPHGETLREYSRKLIEEALVAQGGNVSQAARQLGVSRGTLYRRLRGWREEDGKGAPLPAAG